MPRAARTVSPERRAGGDGSVAKSTEFIAAEYLPNLKAYKYSGCDYSILSRYVLKYYWDWVVSLVPLSVAPNFITFTGFLIGISPTFIQLYYYLVENAVYPSWIWYYMAFSLFAYQTLDAIDGKQARRTRTGSPLGELVDHGCDAFLTPFVAMNTAAAANMPPWLTYAYMMQYTTGLFAAIWEQFTTGILDLGYLSGPTEGILLVCVLYIIAGRYTPAVFDAYLAGPYEYTIPANAVTRVLGLGPVTVHLESARSFLMAFFFVSWLFTIATNLVHACFKPTVHNTRRTAFLAALPIVAAAVLNAALFAAFPEAHRRYPFVFELSLALLICFTVTRLTIARLCMMPYRPLPFYYLYTVMIYVALLFLKVIPAGSISAERKDTYVGVTMILLTLMGVFQYARMVVVVFRQVAAYLGVEILHIRPMPEKRA